MLAHLPTVKKIAIMRTEKQKPKGEQTMKLTYTTQGDYLLPNLEVPEAPKVGKYGMLRRSFLLNHKKALYTGMMLADKLKIRVKRRDMIRGALLHDYFLYDWHDKDHINPFKLHGFFHPGRALKNATRDFELTEREKDIIRKHMWPMTVILPMCREAWIVTVADKWVSLKETLRIEK